MQGRFIEKFKRYHKHVMEFATKARDLPLAFTTLSAELPGSGTEAERQIRSMCAKYLRISKKLLILGKQEGKTGKELGH